MIRTTHHSGSTTPVEEHNGVTLIHASRRSQLLNVELVISKITSGSSHVTTSDVEEVTLMQCFLRGTSGCDSIDTGTVNRGESDARDRGEAEQG